jgi:hypothetical protein
LPICGSPPAAKSFGRSGPSKMVRAALLMRAL